MFPDTSTGKALGSLCKSPAAKAGWALEVTPQLRDFTGGLLGPMTRFRLQPSQLLLAWRLQKGLKLSQWDTGYTTALFAVWLAFFVAQTLGTYRSQIWISHPSRYESVSKDDRYNVQSRFGYLLEASPTCW